MFTVNLTLGCLGIVFYCTLVSSFCEMSLFAQTEQGLVKGQIADDGDYLTFLGIRYAQVNESDPFGPALPPANFDGVFYASDGQISCPTVDGGTLDCLRLNIYVPSNPKSSKPLPVLFWIIGGRFIYQYAGLYTGKYLAQQDVITVIINYRLGGIGFLCPQIPELTGNEGLRDQAAALRWVYQNIAEFGGDPNHITLGGQSAGAASVYLHLFSPDEKLFDKVMMHSAPVLILKNSEHRKITFHLSARLGFNTTNLRAAVRFIKSTPVSKVITASTYLLNVEDLQISPCFDRPTSPISFVDPLLYEKTERKIESTPFFIGINSEERKDSFDGYEWDSEFNYASFTKKKTQRVKNTTIQYYLGDLDCNEEAAKRKFESFASDAEFNSPNKRKIDAIMELNPGAVYSYVFSYDKDAEEGNGLVAHAGQMKYFLQDSSNMTEEEILIRERMTTLCANFVKYGNPTPMTSELLPVIWQPVVDGKRPFLNITATLQMSNRFQQERMAFWDLLYLL